jgi:hypothetical protein
MVRLRALLRRSTSDRELDEELRFHVERAIQRSIAHGMSEPHARYAAQREFGNLTAITEDARDAWRWQWVEQTRQDVRYAVRVMNVRHHRLICFIAQRRRRRAGCRRLDAAAPCRPPTRPAVASHGGSYPLSRVRRAHQVFFDAAAVFRSIAQRHRSGDVSSTTAGSSASAGFRQLLSMLA